MSFGSMPAGAALIRHTRSGILLLLALACSGDTGGPDPDPDDEVMDKASPSGDNQTALAGQALPAPLRVRIRAGTTPLAGRTVTWQPSGGQVSPGTSTTGNDGIATTTVTLPQGGQITIQAIASAVSGSPQTFTASVAGMSATVAVRNNFFDPAEVTILAGGTVTFDWPNGSLDHNVLPDDGKAIPREDAIRDGPFSISVTFPTAGEYYYHCSVHGSTRSGMFGKIVVAP